MNLKTRIKKMEGRAKISDFCVCRGNPRSEIVYYENGKPATSEIIKDNSAPVPDFCEACSKPINKLTIIIDFVESNIPKPEGAK